MDEQGGHCFRLIQITFSTTVFVDQEWLDVVNNDRTKGGNDRVTCESFEIIMDRLEKEWFDLVCKYSHSSSISPTDDRHRGVDQEYPKTRLCYAL